MREEKTEGSIRIFALDVEKILASLEGIERALRELRTLLTEGLDGGQGLGLSGLQWKLKDKSPAGDDAAWAWDYALNQDGTVRSEVKPLVEAVQKAGGQLKIGRYVISINGKFLHRRLVKAH
ncbi:MAG: hypothetical protein QXH67_00050 [Candidatus Bathyarchaeia archaeon]